MAKPKKERKPAPAAEVALQNKIDTLKQQIGDKEATAKQAEDMKALRNELAQKKFVRIANNRVPKALKAIAGIGNLSGSQYQSTPEQQKAILDALRAEVSKVETKLAGKKETVAGFVLS